MSEIIYTSGASEANNLALKGIALKYQKRGKHIITTHYEHPTIYGPLNYLQTLGFEVEFVESDEFGRVSLEHLKTIMRDDTILVTVCAINSEIGIIQPIDEIGKFIHENYPKCFYHVDLTQAIGKIKFSLKNIDLASLSAQKFFGIKGVGALIKKEKIQVEPLIHGGKSTTIYRSGTPALPLIVSLSKAMRLATEDIDNKYNYVKELNKMIVNGLKDLEDVYINSNEYCLSNILNISVVGIKPETFMHALEEKEIYISTQTACSSEKAISASVFDLTKDENRASSSLRISLSYITTKEEIKEFIKEFINVHNKLKLK